MPDTLPSITELNDQFGIANHIQFIPGPGELPTAVINNPIAEASVSLLGGQLLSYRDRNDAGIELWLSEKAEFQPGKAIRGGIPIVWPWFGSHPENPDLPNHGLVRTRMWQVISTQALDSGATQLVMAIASDQETLAIWPHEFRLEVTYTFGETVTSKVSGSTWPNSLSVQLTAFNIGEEPFQWSGAFHSYLKVATRTTRVEGLSGAEYRDQLTDTRNTQKGDVRFSSEIDRVYRGGPELLLLIDHANKIEYAVAGANSDSTIVWNPNTTTTKPDMTDTAYQEFICVETGKGAATEVVAKLPTIQPGESDTFSVSFHKRME